MQDKIKAPTIINMVKASLTPHAKCLGHAMNAAGFCLKRLMRVGGVSNQNQQRPPKLICFIMHCTCTYLGPNMEGLSVLRPSKNTSSMSSKKIPACVCVCVDVNASCQKYT